MTQPLKFDVDLSGFLDDLKKMPGMSEATAKQAAASFNSNAKFIVNDNEVKQGLNKIEHETKQTGEKVESTFKSIGKTIAGVFGAEMLMKGFSMLANQAKEFIEAGKKSIERTEELKVGFATAGVAANQLDNAVKANAKTVTDLSNKYAISKGTINEMTAVYLKFGGSTDNLAQKQELIIGLAKRAGISHEMAAKALAKGTDPEIEAQLTKMGIKFEKNATGAERMAIINAKVAGTLDQMKEAADGPLGRMNRLENTISSLKSTIGVLIIETLGKLMPTIETLINAIVPVVQNLMSIIKPILDNLIKLIVPILTQLMSIITPFISQLGSIIGQVFIALMPIISSLLQLAQPIMSLITQLLPPIMGIVNAIISLISTQLQNFVGYLVEVFKKLIPVIMEVIKSFLPYVDVIMKLVSELLPPLMEILKIAIDLFVSFIPLIFKIVEIWIKMAVIVVSLSEKTHILEGILWAVKSVFQIITSVVEGVVSVYIKIYDWIIKLVDGFTSFLGLANEKVEVKVTKHEETKKTETTTPAMPEGTKSEHKEKAKKEKAAKKEKDDGTKDLSNYYEKTEGERQKIIKDSNKAIQQQKIADLEYEKNLVLENTNLTELEKLQKTLAIEKQINTEKLLMNLQANSEQKAIDDKKLQDAADAEKAKQEKLVKGKTISKEEAAKREKQIDDDLKKSLAENDIKFDNLETQITENSLKDKSKIELENAKKTADEKKKLKELDVKWEERLELDKLDNIENEQEKKRAKELYDLKKKYDDDVKLYGDDAKKKEIIDKQYAANVKKINDKDNPFNKENLNKMSQTFGNTFGDMFAMSKNFFGSLKKAGLGAIFDLAQKQLLALQIPIVGMFSSFIPPPFGEIAGWTLFGTLEGILGGLKSQVGANTGYSPGDSLGSPDSTDTTPVMFDAKNENIMNAKTKQYTPLFKHLNKTGDLGSFPGLSNMFVNQNGKLIDNVSPNFNFQNTQTSMESKLSNIEKQVTNGKDRNINVKTSAKVENFGVKVKRDEIEYLMRDYPERSFG